MAPKVRFPLVEFSAHLATEGLSPNAQRLYVAAIRRLLKRHPEPTGSVVVNYSKGLDVSQRKQFDAAWARYCDHLRAQKKVAGSEDPATLTPPLELPASSNPTDGRRGERDRTEGESADRNDPNVIPPEASSDWLASD